MPIDAPETPPERPEPPAEPDAPHVPTGSDYVSNRRFADFPVSPEVLRGISELGYVTATPVQAATIESALAGRHMLVRAKTGTGKTAAFSVPIVERIPEGAKKPTAIILAPTRELAQQIGEECAAIAKYKDCTLAVLVGGLAMGPQEEQLEHGAAIIVGTPGRILDHLRRKNLDLSACTMVCLDEADEMLSMGFFEDVTAIIDATSKDRQVLLYSATISDETQRLADKYLHDAEDFRLSTDADNVHSIEHILYETTPDLHKVRALLYLIDIEDPSSAIIFCNTREDTATVASFLDRQGLDVQLLSGELSQARRSQVMTKVKAGEVRFLVSTDVASRGIDISDLSHVINYSLPQDPSSYLHRTGRTGRIGKSGTAISLVGGTDLATRKVLETKHGIRFDVRLLPDSDTAVQHRVERQARQIREAMGTLVFESYLPTARILKERPDGEALIAAAIRAFFQWDRTRRAAMSEVDSISDLIQQRNEKLDRKGRRDSEPRRRTADDGRRDERRSGGRRDDGPRRDDRRSEGRRDDGRRDKPVLRREGTTTEDLDLLLVSSGDAATVGAVAPVAATVTPASEGVVEGVEVADATDADGERKKKRRRRKKKGAPGEAGTDESPDESGESRDPGIDDLDALLSAE